MSDSPYSPGAPISGGHYGGDMPPTAGADAAYGYPQTPAYMPSPRPPVPRIEVGDAVKWAWSKTFANPLIIAWIPLSLAGMGLVVGGLLSLVDDDSLNAAIGIPGVLVWALIMYLGIQSAALRVARGERVTLRSFVAPPNGFDAAAALVLVGLASVVASLVPFGGVVAGYFFWVTAMAAMNEGCSCFTAIGRSCRLMKQGGNAPVVLLVLGVIHLVGMLTAVGWLITGPMVALMTAYVYMRMSGGDVAR
ncbi:hypothetical protein [Actinomyces sp. ZJ308]|uniref:hypothetical protein n=1 Tax=Actinomyces sp. ZJ308 TaxID=2708342 RepID=UPI001FBAAB24|nr:hypothetical protein [Actinomyces sp. ZJ308]